MLQTLTYNKIISILAVSILAFALGITFNWLLSLLIIGLIIAYYLPNQKYLILLAAFLLLILPLVWWWSEDWVSYLADAIFCLLLFYLILNISDIKIPENLFEDLPVNKLFPYAIYLCIIAFFIFLPFGVYQSYQNLIQTKQSVKITLASEPHLNQLLSMQIINPEQSSGLILNLIKPNQKIQAYQIKNTGSNINFDIPASDLKDEGEYELVLSSTTKNNHLKFHIND